MKKTMEEILQEQGLEQECIYDFLYPERKGDKRNTVVDQNSIQLQHLQNDERMENNMTTKQQAAEAFERYLETGNFEYAKVVADYLLCIEVEEDEEC